MPGRSLNPHLWSKFRGGGTCIWSWISSPLKITWLGLFFRTRQCTRVHRLILGVQKTCKIGEKRVCFWSYWRIWKGHEDKIKKNACRNAYQGSIFIPEKYVLGCFKSPKPFYEDDVQWRHQNFLWGHRGVKMRFWGGKYPKKLPKMAYFCHFVLLTGGGSVPMPPWCRYWWYPAWDTSVPPPPESKLIYEYGEKNLENSVGPSIEFPVTVFSTFNRRDLNFRDPWFKKGYLKFSTLV